MHCAKEMRRQPAPGAASRVLSGQPFAVSRQRRPLPSPLSPLPLSPFPATLALFLEISPALATLPISLDFIPCIGNRCTKQGGGTPIRATSKGGILPLRLKLNRFAEVAVARPMVGHGACVLIRRGIDAVHLLTFPGRNRAQYGASRRSLVRPVPSSVPSGECFFLAVGAHSSAAIQNLRGGSGWKSPS